MDISTLNKKTVYWWLQIGGWSFYIFMAFLLNQFRGISVSFPLFISLFSALCIGVLTSHLYRETIIRFNLLNLNLIKIVPILLLLTIIFSALFEVLYYSITYLIVYQEFELEWVVIFQEYLGWVILFLLWSLFYYIYHIFKNYKIEEIKNLKWEATKNEIELNKLKSQLNPHFIFNAMNSIRALVDEEPRKAKKVITQLSNVLRNNLLMGKKKVIPLEEELKLVKDYLAIESARFEERLQFKIKVPKELYDFLVPPIMIQTLVENGIKHGISKIPAGGLIMLEASINKNNLKITITNPGKYIENNKPETGFGIENTKERLKLIYNNQAQFSIENIGNNQVKTQVIIPQTLNKIP